MRSLRGSRRPDFLIAAMAGLAIAVTACAGSNGGAKPTPKAAGPMTIERLDQLIKKAGKEVKRQGAVWQFRVDGVPVLCIANAKADRMRFVAPIIELKKMTGEQLQRTMQANFHSALDARYAVRGGVLYSAYIHPLGALQAHQLRSGLFQTVNLVKTFGTTYSSGGLQFGRPGSEKSRGGPSTEI